MYILIQYIYIYILTQYIYIYYIPCSLLIHRQSFTREAPFRWSGLAGLSSRFNLLRPVDQGI